MIDIIKPLGTSVLGGLLFFVMNSLELDYIEGLVKLMRNCRKQ
jgi:hypothetical protein